MLYEVITTLSAILPSGTRIAFGTEYTQLSSSGSLTSYNFAVFPPEVLDSDFTSTAYVV